MARRTVLVVLALCAAVSGGKGRGGNGKWRAKQEAKAPEPKPEGFEGIECKKCMSAVMRLLVPANRGCPAGNGTVIPSSSPLRAPPAFCDTELPKRRKCVTYSFGISGAWDFDKAMVARGCRVISFDPTCCGAAHRVQEKRGRVGAGRLAREVAGSRDEHVDTMLAVLVPCRSRRAERLEYGAKRHPQHGGAQAGEPPEPDLERLAEAERVERDRDDHAWERRCRQGGALDGRRLGDWIHGGERAPRWRT